MTTLEDLLKLQEEADFQYCDADERADSAGDPCRFVTIYNADVSNHTIARVVCKKDAFNRRDDEVAIANAKFLAECVNYVSEELYKLKRVIK